MNLWIVIAGTIGLISLAMMLFMMTAFTGGGIVNLNSSISKTTIKILDISMFALPATCIVAIAVIWIGYVNGADSKFYWWFVLPAPFIVLYFEFASRLSRRQSHG